MLALLLVGIVAMAIVFASMRTDDARAGLGRVVALGDSSASGDGIGTAYPDTPSQCERTPNGYPALAIAQTTHSEFVNETCAGATVSSLYAGSTGVDSRWIRAQLEALNGTEKVVILSIGDNQPASMNFGNVSQKCLVTDLCAATYGSGSSNTLAGAGPEIASAVGGALDSIHSRSPKATIFLVGYLDIAPASGGGCSGSLAISAGNQPVFETWEQSINSTLAAVATQHNAKFVDAYGQSTGHDACKGSARWVNGVSAPSGDGAGLHPNSAGAHAVASMLLSAMASAGLDVGPTISVETLGFGTLHRAKKGSAFQTAKPSSGGRPIMLTLDSAAKVSFKLEKVESGRLSGTSCKALTTKNRKAKKCSRHIAKTGWWKTSLAAGGASVWVTGRAGGKALPSGTYRVRVQSSDLPVSDPVTMNFKIAK
ncbi:MAG: SGNH/GDSL hydrolase family protein [Solirubrobacterales bacterium]